MNHADAALRAVTLQLLRAITAVLAVGLLTAAALANDVPHAPVTCLALSPDGSQLIDGSVWGLRLRRWQDFEVIRELSATCLQIHDLQWNTAGTRLAVVGGDPAESGQVELYSWPTLELQWKKQFSSDVLYSAAFDAADSLLAVGGHDHQVHVLDPDSGEVIRLLTGHSKPVTVVAFVNSTNLIVSGSVDQTIRVWDAADGTLVRSLTNHTRPINHLAMAAPVAQTLPLLASVGDDKAVRFWQPTIGRMVRFQRLSVPVMTVAWSIDGQQVYAGTAAGQVISVDKDTLQMETLLSVPGVRITCLVVHPGGRELAVGATDGHVYRSGTQPDEP